jgi:hypothetical protein
MFSDSDKQAYLLTKDAYVGKTGWMFGSSDIEAVG